MAVRSVAFLIPGDLQAATGGYGYDRRIIEGLRVLGWRVDVCRLDDSFPFPTSVALEQADAVLTRVPDGALVMVDGLALGAMPDVAARHGERVRLVALVHHPLAAETGLSREVAQGLERSEREALRAARHVVVTSEATAAALAPYGVERPRITVIVPGTDGAPVARGSGVISLEGSVGGAGRDGSVGEGGRNGSVGDGCESSGGDGRREGSPGASAGAGRIGRSAAGGAGAGDFVQLVCVATLTPRKGYDVLIDSLAPLASLAWKLTCVGSLTRGADTVAALREQISRAGLEQRVALVGELTGDALEAVYQTADLFVLPTRHEGYGMVIAEALARGIPVISTRTGAIPDLVGANAGLLVPPGDGAAFRDALASALGNAALLASLRSGALAARNALPRWPQSCARMSQVLETAAQ